ncbi:MAG: hypothetical protein QOI55_1807, partial [Actinomycetota bacterium]|nr:hypothetical protein [Actinomycetota bacterium]
MIDSNDSVSVAERVLRLATDRTVLLLSDDPEMRRALAAAGLTTSDDGHDAVAVVTGSAADMTAEPAAEPAAMVRTALERGADSVVVVWSYADGLARTTSSTPRAVLASLRETGSVVELNVVDDALFVVVRAAGVDGANVTIDEASVVDALFERVATELYDQVVDRANERRRQFALLETVRKAHLRQVDALLATRRYRIGDAFVRSLGSPRDVARLPKTLIDLYRTRGRHERGSSTKAPLMRPPRRQLRVASILDEFSEQCFRPEAELRPLQPDQWREQLGRDNPAFLFVESAWQGNGGRWKYALSQFPTRNPNLLLELLDEARSLGLPTVFWNKEDPVNFEVFLHAARHFDVVFTTDANVVDRYVESLGHDRVYPLPFAAQPAIHNPMGARRDVIPRVCFAGSWRGDKYEQRAGDFRNLLDPALELGVLDIFDRYANHKRADELGFPEPYRQAVVGSLSYTEMLDAYKQYGAFLNVNSVTDSPTMFSRRVFEILACATPVITTPSQGIEEMLGEVVITTTSAGQTKAAVEQLLQDPSYRDRLGQRGYRHVMREHTYSRRFDTVLSGLGLPVLGDRRPLVSVICVSNRPERLEHALENYRRQTYRPVELIFVMNSSRFDRNEVAARVAELPKARCLYVDEAATLADCLNEALTLADGEYFAKFDDDDHYGDDYLNDLMLPFDYSDAAIVGKRTTFMHLEGSDVTLLRNPGREFTFVPVVAGA